VQSVTYNGKDYDKSFITYDMIANGGLLVFQMGSEPNTDFGLAKESRPSQKITDNLITPVPVFTAKSSTFEKSMEVGIEDLAENAMIKMTLNGEPLRYSEPFEITQTTQLVASASANGVVSFPETAEYLLIPANRKVTVITPYDSQYTAGGDVALINTIRGGNEFRTGNWQGYHGTDMEVVVDLGEPQMAKSIGAGFLQDENSWIFMPASVSFEVSEDGTNFTNVGIVENSVSPKQSGGIIHDFVVKNVNKKIRYIRVKAVSQGLCPDWHVGAGEPSWIFADEIWVN